MKTVLQSSVTYAPAGVVYKNVLLDLDFAGYSYAQPLPVFLYFGTGDQVGHAILHKKGDILYATLELINGPNYTTLYPHIPFDSCGRIQAVVLSWYPCYDEAVPALGAQAAPPSHLKDVA